MDDRWLATTATTRNANSATQLCGSAIVNVPTGGMKKKFRVSIAAHDVATATIKVVEDATKSTTRR